ncbi:MAG TPA: hypothetical protein DC012_04605 [Escherichia sp.]|nr:hypothetical protein [Escherichia sp.]
MSDSAVFFIFCVHYQQYHAKRALYSNHIYLIAQRDLLKIVICLSADFYDNVTFLQKLKLQGQV